MVAVVISELADGVRRFSELRRAIAGISQRMLTLTLRQLEHEGLVRRTVFPVVPLGRLSTHPARVHAARHHPIARRVASEHGHEFADARAR